MHPQIGVQNTEHHWLAVDKLLSKTWLMPTGARLDGSRAETGVPDRRPGVFEHSTHSVWRLWHLNSVWRLQHSLKYLLLPALVCTRVHGSAAEWLACWTQAQKGLGSNHTRDVSSNSLRQTVHTHRACSPSSKTGSSPLKGCEGSCRPGGK